MISLETAITKMQRKIRRNIHNLNDGGCIQFAYYFSKKLTELKISHQLAFINGDKIYTTYEDFRAVTHVLIHIEDIGYIDGYGTYERFDDLQGEYYVDYFRHTRVSLDKLNHFRCNAKWNSWYNTSQNSLLEEIIDKYLKAGNGRNCVCQKRGSCSY